MKVLRITGLILIAIIINCIAIIFLIKLNIQIFQNRMNGQPLLIIQLFPWKMEF